jgi:hypothetical protein
MTNRITSFRSVRIISIGVFTILFLILTSPATLPAIFLIVPFISIFSFIYLLTLEVVRLLGPDEDENGAIVLVRRPRLLSAVIAGFPVLLLVLQSIVELTIWDIAIAFMILLLAYIYVSRGSVTFRK